MDEEVVGPSGIEASRQNRVLRLRVAKLDEAWETQRRITSQVERARQYIAEINAEMQREVRRARTAMDQYRSALFRMEEEIGWLQWTLMEPGSAEWEIWRRRRVAGRCPACGSVSVSPAYHERSADGDEMGYGLSCGACGFTMAGGDVMSYRPFVDPGQPGSHDTMDDYDLADNEHVWVLRRPDRSDGDDDDR